MRSGVISKVLLDFGSGSPSSVTYTWPELGSETNYSITNPTEERVNGVSIEIARMVEYVIAITKYQPVSAYTEVFLRAASATPPTAPTAGDPPDDEETLYASVGLLDEGSIEHEIEARAGADRMPRYRRTSLSGTLMVPLTAASNTALAALNNTFVDVALKRADGTYRYYYGVWLTYTPAGPSGPDRSQMARIMIAGSTFAPLNLINAYAASGQNDIVRLFTAMAGAENCAVTFTHEDGTTMEVDPTRFTVRVGEEIGGGGLSQILVEGAGFAPTAALITHSTLS